MEIKFADTFFKSLERMVNRQKWYWQTWDFLRYDLPNGVKNIFFLEGNLELPLMGLKLSNENLSSFS